MEMLYAVKAHTLVAVLVLILVKPSQGPVRTSKSLFLLQRSQLTTIRQTIAFEEQPMIIKSVEAHIIKQIG